MSHNNRILIVEDEPIAQIVISGMLKNLGYDADIVPNGQEALKRFGVKAYDLVFMDCLMPVMGGLEATGKIREIESSENRSCRSIIIALTARALTGDRERCLAAGMDDYLPKPLEMEQLKEVLGKYLA